MENKKKRSGGYALIPFLVFIVIYFVTGIILQNQGVDMAFYQMPAPVAAFVAVISAFIIFKEDLNTKFATFIEGCGNEDIISMCLIYLLAGAFSAVAEASGGRDAVVNLGLRFIPPSLIIAGIFVIAGFMATATGTSVGTVSSLTTVTIGLAQGAGLNVAMSLAALVSGSMFGDNLSIISDTTIAATKTQNVSMKDKFRMNLKIALPAAIVAIILFIVLGRPDSTVPIETGPVEIIKVLPYLLVLITAIVGVNVFVVLTSGIIFSSLIMLFQNGFDFIALSKLIYDGFASMNEIFLLSMMIGGLSYMVNKEGGLDFINDKILSFVKSKKSAEFGICLIVFLMDIAIANNTVSIVIAGPIAKRLSNDYKVDPRRSASLLDIFACIGQGIIPYGIQLLVAAKFTEGLLAPVDIMPYLFYQYLLAAFAIISIFDRYAESKDPWDFEYDMPESQVAELAK